MRARVQTAANWYAPCTRQAATDKPARLRPRGVFPMRSETCLTFRSYHAPTARECGGKNGLSDDTPENAEEKPGPGKSYRAITRHTDGRIIHVWDFKANSNAEAIVIVTARGADFRTDLWGDHGLVQRFGNDPV
jgi:hypothetical protein